MVGVIFYALAAICYAVMWKLQFHHSKSVFKKAAPASFWGSESWKRKWAYGTEGVEIFPGSSTAFVFLTDGFHLMQFFFLWLMSIASVPVEIWHNENRWVLIGFIFGLRAAWWIGFNVTFKVLSRK